MPVGNGCPAALALQGPAPQPGHLGIQARLVDEDKPFRVEVELGVKPVPALLQQARALLLQRMGGLFLYVKPWLRSHLLSMDRPMPTSRSSARRTTISSRVMSFRASIMATMKASCASSRG